MHTYLILEEDIFLLWFLFRKRVSSETCKPFHSSSPAIPISSRLRMIYRTMARSALDKLESGSKSWSFICLASKETAGTDSTGLGEGQRGFSVSFEVKLSACSDTWTLLQQRKNLLRTECYNGDYYNNSLHFLHGYLSL